MSKNKNSEQGKICITKECKLCLIVFVVLGLVAGYYMYKVEMERVQLQKTCNYQGNLSEINCERMAHIPNVCPEGSILLEYYEQNCTKVKQ